MLLTGAVTSAIVLKDSPQPIFENSKMSDVTKVRGGEAPVELIIAFWTLGTYSNRVLLILNTGRLANIFPYNYNSLMNMR